MRKIILIILLYFGVLTHMNSSAYKDPDIVDQIATNTTGNKANYIILNKECSFEEQVIDRVNCIFEIRDSFDLNKRQIALLDGCTLLFRGGSVNNGTIIGNQTIIDAPNYQIFGETCSLKGSFINTYLYADWFDDLQLAVDIASQNSGIIMLSARQYELKNSLLLYSRVSLIGCGNEGPGRDNKGTILFYGGAEPVISIHGSAQDPRKNISIKNIKIRGNGDNFQSGSNVGIYIGPKASFGQFENLSLYGCSNGIELDNAWNLRFENVNTYYCYNGFYLNGTSKAPLTTTVFSTCVAYNCSIGFNFEGNMSSTTIESCATDGCSTGMILRGCLGVTVSSFMFEKHSKYGLYIDSLDCYATINGLCPRSPKSDDVVHIKIDKIGRVTFSDMYISKYVIRNKSYSVVVDPESTAKTCFNNCYINGKSVNLEKCVIR